MKNIILTALVLMPLLAYSNENSGVKELSYHVGFSYAQQKNDGVSNWDSKSLSASINIPIYDYIGSNIRVDGTKAGDVKYRDYIADSSIYSTSGTLFIRDKDIGKVGVSAGYSESKTKITSSSPSIIIINNSFNLKSYIYSLYGSYYFNDFTFSASRSVDDLDNGHKINTWSVGASYYFNENTIFNANQMGMDSSNSYIISISHQPYFLNDSTEVGLSYWNNKYSSSISFLVKYYFGTKVSLKTRDREYR